MINIDKHFMMTKRKFGQGSSHFHAKRRMRSPDRMRMGAAPNLQEALLTLGIHARDLVDQNRGYRSGPPKRIGYNKGPSYRDSRPFRGKRGMLPKKGAASRIKARNEYRCLFCNIATLNQKVHMDHLKSQRHINTVVAREAFLKDKLRKLSAQVQEEARTVERTSKGPFRFCQVCHVNYAGSYARHDRSAFHQEYLFMTEVHCLDCHLVFTNRFRFEKHLLSLDHIRNRHYSLMKRNIHMNLKDIMEVKEYDSSRVTGYEFIGDVRGYYCQICEEFFLFKDMSLGKHSQSEKHYEKFKEYAKKRLQELEQKKTQQKESGSTKEEDTQGDEPMEEDEEETGHESEQVEEDDENEAETEDVEEQAEDGEDEQGEDVEDEQAENVEDEQAEDVEDEQAEDVEDEQAEDVEDEQAEDVEDEQTEDVEDEQAEDVEDEQAEDEQTEDVEDEQAEDVEDEQVEDEQVEDVEDEQVEDEDEEVENLGDEDVEVEEAENADEEAECAEEQVDEEMEAKVEPSPAVPQPRRSRRSR